MLGLNTFMAQIRDETVSRDLGTAPSESGLPVSTPYNFIYNRKLMPPAGGGNLAFSGSLADLCGDKLEGMGHVECIRLSVKFVGENVGDNVTAVIVNASNAQSIDTLRALMGCRYHKCTSFNQGLEHVMDFEIPVNLSKQIVPLSSNLPMPKLKIKASVGSFVSVSIFAHFTGFIQFTDSLNST